MYSVAVLPALLLFHPCAAFWLQENSVRIITFRWSHIKTKNVLLVAVLYEAHSLIRVVLLLPIYYVVMQLK